jgi:hypothetical protein
VGLIARFCGAAMNLRISGTHNLKTEVLFSSETLELSIQTRAWFYNPEDYNMNLHLRENIKSYISREFLNQFNKHERFKAGPSLWISCVPK